MTMSELSQQEALSAATKAVAALWNRRQAKPVRGNRQINRSRHPAQRTHGDSSRFQVGVGGFARMSLPMKTVSSNIAQCLPAQLEVTLLIIRP